MDISNGRRTGRKSHHCTGHTLKRWYSKGPYYETYRGQFSIHKGLRIYDPHFPEEIAATSSEVFKECLDDGGLEANVSWNAVRYVHHHDSVLYSQNKRKRWLLPQLLKDNIADTSCHDNLDFKVVLEERELIMPMLCLKRRARPDCIRVYESKSEQPEKLPNHKYSYATDLRKKGEPTPRLKDPVEEDLPPPEPKMMEIYYEICYARPGGNTPWSTMLYPYVNSRKVISTKASSKVKHQKNKCYSYWHGLSDSYDWAQDVRDRWDEDEAVGVEVETEMVDNTCLDFAENIVPVTLPTIGDVITYLLENSDNSKSKKRSKKAGQKCSCEDIVYPNRASSNPVKMLGKGATIDEEPQETSDDHLDNKPSENEPALDDVQVYKYTEQDIRFTKRFKFATPTTLPSHLKNTFGSVYIECMSHPRRFAVDVAHQFTACEDHVYVLFEMMDNYTNGSSVSYKWHNTGDGCETLDLNQYTSVRVSLIISPQVYALNEEDFSDEMLDESGEVHTVVDVVRWIADTVNDRIGITIKSNTCKKKSSRFVRAIDTVTKASDWQLIVDTPRSVYKDIQQKAKAADPCNIVADFSMELSPFCGICYESLLPYVCGVDATAINACDHRFCDDCWTQYFRSRVKQGDFNITCPGYECKSAIDIVTKMALMTTADFFHHLDHQRDATLNRKAEWQWCPNPRCGCMACVVSGTGGVVVNCVCGWLWCSQCMQEAHWPATCKQAARYRDILNVTALSKDKMPPIISVEVKRCPTCNYPMEKNGGCPNMICRLCDTSFCWNCLGLWSQHSWTGMNLRCPTSSFPLETVYLDQNQTVEQLLLIIALHHRQWRTKRAIKKCRTNAHMLSAKEFLKESTSSYFNTSTSVNQGEWAENLPITWASSATSFASLAEKASKGQECAQFCLEAHFVLEFLAIYMAEKNGRTWKKRRRQFSSLTDRLEFITQRLDEVLQARLNLSRAWLLTQHGKDCLKRLALKMKKTQNVEETE